MRARRAKPVEHPSELQLFLRIKHPSLDPAEISQTLDIDPAQAIAAGSDVSSTGVRRLHSESYWIAQLATTAIRELVERFREGLGTEEIVSVGKDDLLAMMGATGHDSRIMFRLKPFEAHKEFFERINSEGGSVTLIVDRGDSVEPVVLKRALAKLAELGMTLEVD